MNVLSVSKTFFSFCEFFSDEVEIIFWERKTEPSRSFEFKVGDTKIFKKWFSKYFELKDECSERL